MRREHLLWAIGWLLYGIALVLLIDYSTYDPLTLTRAQLCKVEFCLTEIGYPSWAQRKPNDVPRDPVRDNR